MNWWFLTNLKQNLELNNNLDSAWNSVMYSLILYLSNFIKFVKELKKTVFLSNITCTFMVMNLDTVGKAYTIWDCLIWENHRGTIVVIKTPLSACRRKPKNVGPWSYMKGVEKVQT